MYNKQDYFNLIEELEDIFWELTDFFEHPSENEFYCFDDAFLAVKEDNKELAVDSGCTKGVIISDNLNYVIKVPFLADHEIDYCAKEVQVYQKAIEEGIEEFFAPSYCIGTYKDVPIYIMEKAEIDGVRLKELGVDIYRKTHKVKKDSYDDWEIYDNHFSGYENRRLVKYLFNYYYSNPAKVDKLLSFLDKEYINDIHAYNIGLHDNKTILIDYSGI